MGGGGSWTGIEATRPGGQGLRSSVEKSVVPPNPLRTVSSLFSISILKGQQCQYDIFFDHFILLRTMN
jgi:hypothetical protein